MAGTAKIFSKRINNTTFQLAADQVPRTFTVENLASSGNVLMLANNDGSTGVVGDDIVILPGTAKTFTNTGQSFGAISINATGADAQIIWLQ